ncbi:hypothetical protein CBR_g40859 [Chara braunii]|uniref:Uncharacterized protein n=1 Tax=Chara braunii TaxID=69332 RepID=A0A388K280_CHABU|nr:hypothetical protein CBR_g40859 [Chara braunii]|eukprot:GBG64160.1 hypothetical protein CBR_g40859 [Chara braunii]
MESIDTHSSSTARPSVLQKHQINGKLLMSSMMTPLLSESGITFNNFAFDPNSQKLEELIVPTWKLSLISASNIPSPGPTMDACRWASFLCLYDGNDFVGNVISLEARKPYYVNEVWDFCTKWSSGQFIVRHDAQPTVLKVYVELNVCHSGIPQDMNDAGIAGQREAEKERGGELGKADWITYAWGLIDLPKATPSTPSIQFERNNFDIPLYGGSLENPVDLKPKKGNQSLWESLVKRGRMPVLRVKIQKPRKSLLDIAK